MKYQVDEDGKALLDENGDPVPAPSHSDTYGTWRFDYHTLTAEEAERIKSLIRTARPLPTEDAEIWTIINEEAEAFFHGSKSAEQVADGCAHRENGKAGSYNPPYLGIRVMMVWNVRVSSL